MSSVEVDVPKVMFRKSRDSTFLLKNVANGADVNDADGDEASLELVVAVDEHSKLVPKKRKK